MPHMMMQAQKVDVQHCIWLSNLLVAILWVQSLLHLYMSANYLLCIGRPLVCCMPNSQLASSRLPAEAMASSKASKQAAKTCLLHIGEEANFQLISIATEHVAGSCLLLQDTGPDADFAVAIIYSLGLQISTTFAANMLDTRHPQACQQHLIQAATCLTCLSQTSQACQQHVIQPAKWQGHNRLNNNVQCLHSSLLTSSSSSSSSSTSSPSSSVSLTVTSGLRLADCSSWGMTMGR